MPIISGGGGSGATPDLAAVLDEGNDADAGTILNLSTIELPQGTTFFLTDDAASGTFDLMAANAAAIKFNLNESEQTTFEIRNRGSGTKKSLLAAWNDPDEIILGFATGKVGFYGTVGVAKQTVTSGSVTPAQLANALQALGLLGGT